MGSKFKSIKDTYVGTGTKADKYKLIFSFNVTKKHKTEAFAVAVENETVIAGGNTFSSLESLIGGSSVGGLVNATKNLLGTVLSTSGTSTTPQAFTRMNWSGSQKPQFTFNVTFYSENSSRSVLEDVMKIKKAVYPSGSTGIKGFFTAPLGYRIINPKNKNSKTGGGVTGTLNVKVGTWLVLRDMLVVSESISFSREVNRFGQPLFARGTITLETHKELTFSEFSSMVKIKNKL